MTIIAKLKQSIENATGLRFYYDDRDALNEILDDAEFPCVVMHLVEQGTVRDQLGMLHESIVADVWFEDLAEDGADGIRNEEIIDGMKRSAFKWLNAFRNDENLKLTAINSTGRHYLERDVITTGFDVKVTFEEIDGVSSCDL